MIKPSVLIILVAICALIGIGVYFVVDKRPGAAAANETKKHGSPLIDGFQKSAVDRIRVSKEGVAVDIVRTPEKKWILASKENRPVKADRIASLLNNIETATIDGSRPGKQLAMFQLAPENRATLEIHTGGTSTTVYIGKDAGNGRSFVQTDPNGAVYEIPVDFGNDAGLRTSGTGRVLDPALFYDLNVLQGLEDDVIDIAIKRGHEVVRLQKMIPGIGPMRPGMIPSPKSPKPIWWIIEPEGMAADEAAAGGIAASAVNLVAKAYVDDKTEKELGLDAPTAKVWFRTRDGIGHTATFGKVDGDSVILRYKRDGDPKEGPPFLVYKYLYDSMTKSLKDLKNKDLELEPVVEQKPEPKKEPDPATTQQPEVIKKNPDVVAPKQPDPTKVEEDFKPKPPTP